MHISSKNSVYLILIISLQLIFLPVNFAEDLSKDENIVTDIPVYPDTSTYKCRLETVLSLQ